MKPFTNFSNEVLFFASLSGFNRPVILIGRRFNFYSVRLNIPVNVFSSSCKFVDRLLFVSLLGVYNATDNFARLIVLSVGL